MFVITTNRNKDEEKIDLGFLWGLSCNGLHPSAASCFDSTTVQHKASPTGAFHRVLLTHNNFALMKEITCTLWLSWILILAEHRIPGVDALATYRLPSRTDVASIRLLSPISRRSGILSSFPPVSTPGQLPWRTTSSSQQYTKRLWASRMTTDPLTGGSSSLPFEDGHKLSLVDDDDDDDDVFEGRYTSHVELEYPDQQLQNHDVENGTVGADFVASADGSPDRNGAAGRKSPNQRKKRSNNPAMGDTAFLRKRTSDLMRATSHDHLALPVGLGEDKEVDGEDDTCSVVLGRGMKVGLKTFNFLIDAWAFSGELDAADQALRLLGRMEELYYQPESLDDACPEYHKICPDVRSYTKVINALSRSMRPDAGELAESILDKMENVYMSGENPSAKPNTFTYTAAIEAYANSGAEGSLEKTEELLERMIARYQSGDPDVLPNTRCFNAAISAYAKSDFPGAAQQAEYWLNRMDSLYMSGLQDAKPNSFNYNSLITAWANCQDDDSSAQKAAEVLERMEQCYACGDSACKPTTVSFNAVIDAYAKCRLEDAAERAEQVLRRMEDLYEAGEDVKPNTRSFNSVINAWAKSGRADAAEKSQDLLDFMTRLYEAGNGAVRPDVHSFCTVINGMLVFAPSQEVNILDASLLYDCLTTLRCCVRISHSLCSEPYAWQGRTRK